MTKSVPNTQFKSILKYDQEVIRIISTNLNSTASFKDPNPYPALSIISNSFGDKKLFKSENTLTPYLKMFL